MADLTITLEGIICRIDRMKIGDDEVTFQMSCGDKIFEITAEDSAFYYFAKHVHLMDYVKVNATFKKYKRCFDFYLAIDDEKSFLEIKEASARSTVVTGKVTQIVVDRSSGEFCITLEADGNCKINGEYANDEQESTFDDIDVGDTLTVVADDLGDGKYILRRFASIIEIKAATEEGEE